MATTVELMYSLNEKEIYDGLNASGIFQLSKKKLFIECAVILFCAAFFVYMAITDFKWYYPVISLAAVLFMLFLVYAPKLSIKKQAKAMNGKNVRLRVMMEKLVVIDGDRSWEIKLDGKSYYKIVKSNIVIVTKNNSVLIIPARAFPPERSSELQSRILAGTSEKTV
ncbi:MAG: YcxB family protein [Ruminococcaceae bacterium]|nr:YcxB family protein [Oscillospiraceae bacterium]